MAYTVLARRYRSKSFDELIGQDAIARTLRAAIDSDRVAHAYLFTGTRGVGKTSTARLYAKELAGNPEAGDDDGVNAAIMRGEDTDVIEIDGASNNRVEEARELIANAAYRPLRGRRKVYIIDEVHMLTTQAFNALLKTMEEPPDHVVFILCTTEAEKVPATIQSRCQRFDFRPISSTQIAGQLATILKNEGVKGDPELVHAVARLGNGSMRDALSVLDRLLASGHDTLTLSLLEELLGLPGRETMGEIIDAIGVGDVRGSLERVASLLSQGLGPDRVLESLAERFHDLLLLVACGEQTGLVDLGDDARKQEATRAAMFDDASLTHMIALCEHTQRNMRSSVLPRALLDAAVVRMAGAEKFASIGAILAGQPPQRIHRQAERQQGRPTKRLTASGHEADPTPSLSEPEPASPDITPDAGISLEELWSRARSRESAFKIKRLLAGTRPVERRAGVIVVRLEDEIRGMLDPNREALEGVLARELGQSVRLEIQTGKTAPAEPANSSGGGSSRSRSDEDERLQAIGRNPLVSKVVELFDAEIIEIKPNGPQGQHEQNR